MSMSTQEKETFKILAAVFLLMPEPHALLLGAWICGGALLTVHFFKLTQPLFPKKFFRASVILFLAAFFQISMIFSKGLSPEPFPFWFFSLVLLLDWRDLDFKTLAPYPFPLLLRLGLLEGCLLIFAALQSRGGEIPAIGWLPVILIVLGISGRIQEATVEQSMRKRKPKA